MKIINIILMVLLCMVMIGCNSTSIAIIDEPLTIETDNTTIDGYILNQHTEIIDFRLTNIINPVTLLHDLTIDDTLINITSISTSCQVLSCQM